MNFLHIFPLIFLTASFATLEWSPDETKILYIAEKKIPKSEPFYKQKPKPSDDKDCTDSKRSVQVPILNYMY